MKREFRVPVIFAALLLAAAAVILSGGCSRPPAASLVEFQGKVYYGVENSTTGYVSVVGALPGARVVLVGDNTSVVTDSVGRYTLRADVPRSFSANNTEHYTLEAIAPSTWGGTSQRQSASGRPGDIVYVRDFILYRHYYTDTAGAPAP